MQPGVGTEGTEKTDSSYVRAALILEIVCVKLAQGIF